MKYLIALLFFGCLRAEIIECSRFAKICEYADEDVLLLLDIDDTLLIPVQMLGCDEWFQLRYRAHQERGMDDRQALEKSLAEWEAVRHLTQMEIVEPDTERKVRELQSRGASVSVMGLTTQGLALATRTSLQLRELGIDLRTAAPRSGDVYFENGHHGVLYRNGILFTSGTHKGEALFKLLDQIEYKPKKIVFLNDKASHLAEIEESAGRREIPFIGLRYSYSDRRKEAFRPDVAEYQFHHSSLARLLSDEEALERLKIGEGS